MKATRLAALFAAGLMTGSGIFVGAGIAHASWSSNNCDMSPTPTTVSWARENARSYAATAIGDGYEWGGGCWNGDGVDNSPAAEDADGEGGDCSGFTFKSWAMAKDFSGARRRWPIGGFIHGPYTAADFKGGTGAANAIGKTYATTGQMDAFASATHIGMIYTEDVSGFDYIIEAKGDAAGSGLWRRSYRSDPGYGGSKRASWDTYCPQCG